MADPAGNTLTVGVARLTVMLPDVVVVTKFVRSVGVKVMLCVVVPTAGVVPGVIHANTPDTFAMPPDSVEPDRVCP